MLLRHLRPRQETSETSSRQCSLASFFVKGMSTWLAPIGRMSLIMSCKLELQAASNAPRHQETAHVAKVQRQRAWNEWMVCWSVSEVPIGQVFLCRVVDRGLHFFVLRSLNEVTFVLNRTGDELCSCATECNSASSSPVLLRVDATLFLRTNMVLSDYMVENHLLRTTCYMRFMHRLHV